jgi:MinD-like ATPase involved in chromosome partitioning or flagellar assembly
MTAIDLRSALDYSLETSKTFRAKSVVCWGSVGSGKTSIAVNLSFELANLGHRVCLIDADTYHPSVAALLALTSPGGALTAILRLARQQRLSNEEFARLSKKIDFAGGSVWVIPGINALARWSEVDDISLAALSQELGKKFDILIFDVATHTQSGLVDALSGKERNQATNHLLSSADIVLANFLADPVGVNRFLFDLRSAGREVLPVANRVRPGVIGRNPVGQLKGILEQTTEQKLFSDISEDEGFDVLLQSTRPLLLQGRSSKAQQGLRKLAKEIVSLLER